MGELSGMTARTGLSRRTFTGAAALAGVAAAVAGSMPVVRARAAQKDVASSAMDAASASDALSNTNDDGQVIWTHCAVNCGSTCALRCHVSDGQITYVESDNTGDDAFDSPQLRACPRGRSIRRWLQSPDRLNYPLRRVPGTKRGEGRYQRISWDEALDTIASELTRVRETYGNEAVFNAYASGVSSGIIGGAPVRRLLNLTGGSLGYYGSYSSAQISAAGTYTYGGGSYGSPFTTLQDGQLVVMFGNSPAETRMGGAGHTWDFARMREEHDLRVIVIDPRLNDTVAGQGGEWIPIRPGTDGALACALAYEIINNGWTDEDFLRTYCVGFDEETLPESAKGKHASYKDYILGQGTDGVAKTPAWAAPICGVPEQRIVDLAREMHEADPVFICQGYGVERHSNGEMACRDIMVLPQLLGQIGKPGTTDGRREGSAGLALSSMPSGENPVTTQISCFNWPDAIDHGPEMTALNAGVRGAESLSTGIKFIFNYAGNCLTNQHSDINYTHDLLADDTKCEFIVTSEVFMTDSAKYSDIILPDLTSQEQLNISKDGYADNMIAAIFAKPVTGPSFERRGIYEVCCDLAERLGVYDEFTEGGKTREDWLRQLWEDACSKDEALPTWDEGFEMGVYKRMPEPKISLEDFIADPQANPLKTPSGKIEIYSEQLAELRDTWELKEDEIIDPLPVFDPGYDSYVNLTEEYPLLIVGFQSKASTHSSYANNAIIESSLEHCAWVNPIDAEERGIVDGDTLRVWNSRGEIRITAKVTPRVIPGTVAIPEGKWHDADMNGDRVDFGGCINTLTNYRPTALAKANPQHSNIGQIAKA